MTVIETIYTPIWNDIISMEVTPCKEVTLCKVTEFHFGRYPSKINKGYVIMEGCLKGGKLSGELQTSEQPLHELKAKRMSNKLAREWNLWTYNNSIGFIRELKSEEVA